VSKAHGLLQSHVSVFFFFFFKWIKFFIQQHSTYTPKRKQTRTQSQNKESHLRGKKYKHEKQKNTSCNLKRQVAKVNKTKATRSTAKAAWKSTKQSNTELAQRQHIAKNNRQKSQFLHPQTKPTEVCRFQRNTKLWLRCLNCPLVTSLERASHLIQSRIDSFVLGEELWHSSVSKDYKQYTPNTTSPIVLWYLCHLIPSSPNLQ
jgi:hypothetical protein